MRTPCCRVGKELLRFAEALWRHVGKELQDFFKMKQRTAALIDFL
jgi:hypothetical protein